MRGMYETSGIALRNSFDMFDLCRSGTIQRSKLHLLLSKLNVVVGPNEEAFLRKLWFHHHATHTSSQTSYPTNLLTLLLCIRAWSADGHPGRPMEFDEFLAVFGRCSIRDKEITMDFAVSFAVSSNSPHVTGATMLGDGYTALRSLATKL